MRSFSCDVCGQLLFFENSVCVACGSHVAYLQETRDMVVLTEDSTYTAPDGTTKVVCANLNINACNWLTGKDAPGGLCFNCALTLTRPADDDTVGMAAYYLAETAKRRLIFELDELGLPITTRHEDPDFGLGFDLLSSVAESVTTGQADGLITVDLAESNDVHRERLRISMDEPYRTMLGHFRHEIGHYYWMVLVDGTDNLDRFHELFGDESLDYQEAIDRHYSEGAPAGWEETYVSKYATMHPWEDFAESFAHFLHIRDTLQTASAFGLGVRPDAARVNFTDLVSGTWLPLSYALNQINRGMGKDDLYPFVLAPVVVEKLQYVADLVSPTA